jgi:hypothetical protein
MEFSTVGTLGVGAAFALVLSLATSTAQAGDGLRCGSKLVSTGDTSSEVRSVCGAPDYVAQHNEKRTVRQARSVPCAAGVCVVMVEDTVDVPVEEWTYDFGPHRFLQFLRFEQGRLVRVTSGGYGHKEI